VTDETDDARVATLHLYRLPGSAPWTHRHEIPKDAIYPTQLWASARFPIRALRSGYSSIYFDEIHAGNAAAYYRAYTTPGTEQPHDGWMTINVQLEINARRMGDYTNVPLTFYIGDVTDMCTGLIRFDEGYGEPCPWDGMEQPPCVWMLGARRTI
jgi:hypothetical protein